MTLGLLPKLCRIKGRIKGVTGTFFRESKNFSIVSFVETARAIWSAALPKSEQTSVLSQKFV